jgi:hypothetical protein
MSLQTSTYDRVQSVLDQVVSAAAEKEMTLQHRKLIFIIEADRHLLIGAKALAAHMDQRFTKDTEYLVNRSTYQKVRKWLHEENVEHNDLSESLLIESLAIDVLDADDHPVLKKILQSETGIPSAEALAAMKCIAIISDTRNQRKRYLDLSDFVGLVTLQGFRIERLLEYFVDRFEKQRPRVAEVIGKIRRGDRDIVI